MFLFGLRRVTQNGTQLRVVRCVSGPGTQRPELCSVPSQGTQRTLPHAAEQWPRRDGARSPLTATGAVSVFRFFAVYLAGGTRGYGSPCAWLISGTR